MNSVGKRKRMTVKGIIGNRRREIVTAAAKRGIISVIMAAASGISNGAGEMKYLWRK